ncbi:hypothetical protein FDA33_17495 [Clostridium botulinum]|nr:hypothetical protein [Clostridium botulinum]NFI17176.1 hypothetical protein [Clostridium botulinum]NFL93543.1 hypothetical protein [Clostridium botulinum]NFN51589.1 hypothetical protein [Clostridium botulinum]NFO27550.1 hypothetical protein [Clostridium botulinum]
MEYISEKEFRKQPMEVQQVILEWWKPSKGDLFENDLIGGFGVITGEKKLKNGLIPLLTEGQLRKFIEDKTGGKVILTYNLLNDILIKVVKGNDIHNNALETICRYPIDRKSNVLNAYWKVACQIASKEVIDNE